MKRLDSYIDRQITNHTDEIEWLADLEEEATTAVENNEINLDEVCGEMPTDLMNIIMLAALKGEMINFADPIFSDWRKKEIDRQIAVKFEELKRA